MALRELIDKQRPVCLIIDPAYLAIENGSSRGLFAMGALLRPLADLCEATGCAVLLVHHAKRSHKLGSVPTLDDIAWSGFAEFGSMAARLPPRTVRSGHRTPRAVAERGRTGRPSRTVGPRRRRRSGPRPARAWSPRADRRCPRLEDEAPSGRLGRGAERRTVRGRQRRSAAASPRTAIQQPVPTRARVPDRLPGRPNGPPHARGAGPERRPHEPHPRNARRTRERRQDARVRRPRSPIALYARSAITDLSATSIGPARPTGRIPRSTTSGRTVRGSAGQVDLTRKTPGILRERRPSELANG